MITVNGKNFENYDVAIAYMQREKEKEAKELKNKAKIHKINSALNIAEVTILRNNSGHTQQENHLIFTLSEATNRELFPQAIAEELFGKKYQIRNGVLTERYKIKNYSIDKNPDFGTFFLRCYELLQKNKTLDLVELNGKKYDTIYLFDYTKEKERSNDYTKDSIPLFYPELNKLFSRFPALLPKEELERLEEQERLKEQKKFDN